MNWIGTYENKKVKLTSGTQIDFSAAVCRRAAVKYGKAINMAVKLGKYIAQVHQKLNRAFEIELSVDETPRPTTLAEHYIIADQCAATGSS